MIAVNLLLVSLIPLIILGLLIKKAYRRGLRLQVGILGTTFVHEFLLVVFPIWYSVFTEYYWEHKMMVQVVPIDLLIVMIGEAVFVALFAIGIQIGRKNVIQDKQTATLLGDRQERLFLFLLVGAGLLIYVILIMAPATTLQSTIEHSQGLYFTSAFGMLFAWFRGFFQVSSLVAASLVLVNSKREKYSHILRLMAFSTLALVCLLGLSGGVRGRVVTVASFLAIVGFIKRRKELIYVGLVLIIVMLPFFSFLGGPFRSIYYSKAAEGSTKWDLISTVIKEAGESIKSGDKYDLSKRSFISSFAKRAQAPRNSVVLYQLYNDGLDAGFRPLGAAFVSPIPRMIWQEKGVAGSSDLTTYGSAVYLVRRVGYGSPLYNMGPYLASAHAYWEGGWIWLIFAGFVTGLIWNIILRWCAKSEKAINIIIALTLTYAVLANGFLTALQPLFDFVRLFWAAILPTIMLSKVAGLLFAVKKGFASALHPKHKADRIIGFKGQ